MSKAWRLYVCGCRGSMPMHGDEYSEFGGATSCYILKKGTYALVLDCGSGFCRAKEILKDCGKVDIWLTHLHYDHLMGILSYGVIPKEAEVHFYGTFDHWFRENTIKEFFREPFWPVVPEIGPCVQVDSPGERRLREDLLVRSYPSPHPNGASILRVEAGDKVLCIMFDYEHTGMPPEGFLEGCSLLAFDGMYTEEEYEAHRGWGHSCYLDGCAYAEEYQIPRLYITHHEPGKTDAELRVLEQKARKIYPGARFARMGDVIEL